MPARFPRMPQRGYEPRATSALRVESVSEIWCHGGRASAEVQSLPRGLPWPKASLPQRDPSKLCRGCERRTRRPRIRILTTAVRVPLSVARPRAVPARDKANVPQQLRNTHCGDVNHSAPGANGRLSPLRSNTCVPAPCILALIDAAPVAVTPRVTHVWRVTMPPANENAAPKQGTARQAGLFARTLIRA